MSLFPPADPTKYSSELPDTNETGSSSEESQASCD